MNETCAQPESRDSDRRLRATRKSTDQSNSLKTDRPKASSRTMQTYRLLLYRKRYVHNRRRSSALCGPSVRGPRSTYWRSMCELRDTRTLGALPSVGYLENGRHRKPPTLLLPLLTHLKSLSLNNVSDRSGTFQSGRVSSNDGRLSIGQDVASQLAKVALQCLLSPRRILREHARLSTEFSGTLHLVRTPFSSFKQKFT